MSLFPGSPAAKVDGFSGLFSAFALRRHVPAQHIWRAVHQFDKRATDQY
jgi:hypothetical protein